jgi:hypothetical protein
MPSIGTFMAGPVLVYQILKAEADKEVEDCLKELVWRQLGSDLSYTKTPILAFMVKNGTYLGSLHVPFCRCSKVI